MKKFHILSILIFVLLNCVCIPGEAKIKKVQEKEFRSNETPKKEPEHHTGLTGLPPIIPQVGFETPTETPKRKTRSEYSTQEENQINIFETTETLPPPETLEPFQSLPPMSTQPPTPSIPPSDSSNK
jgi:hypothetical protein